MHKLFLTRFTLASLFYNPYIFLCVTLVSLLCHPCVTLVPLLCHSCVNSTFHNLDTFLCVVRVFLFLPYLFQRWLITVIASAVITLVLGFIIGYLTRRAYHLEDQSSWTGATTQPTVAVGTTSSQVCAEKTSGLNVHKWLEIYCDAVTLCKKAKQKSYEVKLIN